VLGIIGSGSWISTLPPRTPESTVLQSLYNKLEATLDHIIYLRRLGLEYHHMMSLATPSSIDGAGQQKDDSGSAMIRIGPIPSERTACRILGL
jgi:hypothetical protein